MRKLFAILAFVGFVNISYAQSVTDRYNALGNAVEQAKRSIDSVNVLLKQAREQYATHAEERPQISNRISALELEALNLKRKYDKAVYELSCCEQQILLADIARSQGQNKQVSTEEVEVTDNSPQRANLVYNKVFERSLSMADLRGLRQAQQQETDVVSRIREYLGVYDKMVAVQLEYERIDTESGADSLLQALDSLRLAAGVIENGVNNLWHNLYDNKLYAYNLILEKGKRLDVLASAEASLSKAQSQSEQIVSEFESDVLAEYFYRKGALLEYEGNVAKALELTKAQDSLLKAKSALQRNNFCLPKVNIVRRSFIEHEPLKVVKPTLYTSKNPIPQTRIYEFGTVYRIRIGIFTNRPNLSALKGITPLSYTDKYHGGKYAYYVGGFRTEEEAREGVKYLTKLGFRSPVVVMWVDGEYISNIEVWKSKNMGYKIEISGVTTLSDAVKAHISLRNDKAIFSRVGKVFIVGPFVSESDAKLVASEIVAMDGNIEANVKSVKQ
ncbi:MAG: SPOR domain-containing protein [Alistipes sp.]|nr:SPOR domain-containing protein [Alistipes sp.]